MKKFLCLLLTVGVILSLAACGLFGSTAKDWQEQYDLGMRYLDDGDYEEAILAFTAAIEIDGDRPEAYMGRAEAYIAIGEPEKALKDYRRAKKAARRSEEDYDDLLDELEEIIEELEEAVESTENPAATEEPSGEMEETTPVAGDETAATGSEKRLVKVVETTDGRATTETFTYNEQGLIESVVHIYPSDSNADPSTVTYVYDEEDRLVEVWDSVGVAVGMPKIKYHYDENGYLVKTSGRGEGGGTDVIYENDAQGRLVRIIRGGDVYSARVVDEYTYSDDGLAVNVVSTTTSNYDSYSSISYATYTYDEKGRLLSEYHTYSDSSTIMTVYSYDEKGRLISKCYTKTDYSRTTVYSYDYKPFVASGSEDALPNYYVVRDVKGNVVWKGSAGVTETIETDEDGYVIRIIGEDGVCEFFYEDVLSEETTSSESGSTDPMSYDITRQDRSIYGNDGKMKVEHFYDQVVVQGDSEAAKNINAAIETDMDTFFAYMVSWLESSTLGEQGGYWNTASAEVTDNSGIVFCVRVETRWCMGGVGNTNRYGLNFDAHTGEPVYLPELYGMEEADFLSLLKETCWAYVSEKYASETYSLYDNAKDIIYGYELNDFDYYFMDRELIVEFQTYSIGIGAAGCIQVPTGLYY